MKSETSNLDVFPQRHVSIYFIGWEQNIALTSRALEGIGRIELTICYFLFGEEKGKQWLHDYVNWYFFSLALLILANCMCNNTICYLVKMFFD